MSAPLNLRLRDEASRWDENEPIQNLLLEAAEAIEFLATSAAVEEVLRLGRLERSRD